MCTRPAARLPAARCCDAGGVPRREGSRSIDGEDPGLPRAGPSLLGGGSQQAGRRREGDARAQGPQRGAGEDGRRPDDHERRGEHRPGDTPLRPLREYGRSPAARGGQPDQRCRWRRDDYGHRACPGDGVRGDAPAGVIEALGAMARQVRSRDELAYVATVAANNDPSIGRVIADALDAVGREGVIEVEDSPGFGLELEFVEGFQWDFGYLSPYFVTDADRMEVVFENPYILLTNLTISKVQDLMPVLEQVMRDQRPLVVVAENVDGAALGTLVTNARHGTFASVAVRAPGFGHRRLNNLQDIAALTGGE